MAHMESGNKPIISGANILKEPDVWKKDGELYKIDLSDSNNFVMMNQSNWDYENVGFIESESGKIYGNRKSSKEKLDKQFDFYCEGQFLFIKSEQNPSTQLGRAKFMTKNDLVKLSSNTILENIDVRNTGAHGIVCKNSSIENVYIKNCIVQNIGGSLQDEDTFTRYGNGIEFWNQATDTLVENTIIRNVFDAGYTLQGKSSMGGFENNIISNSIFIECTYDVELFAYNEDDQTKVPKMNNIVIQDNISINQGRGWGFDAKTINLQSSVLVLWEDNQISDNAEIICKNNKYFNFRNIFHTDARNPISAKKFKNIVKSDYNMIYMSDTSKLVRATGSFENRDILQEYGQDQNSIFKLLSDNEINQVSNPEIIKSNNYEEIKQYYENLEKEIKFNELAETTITKYTDFQQKYQTDLSTMQDITSTIETLKNEVKTLTTTNLWTHLENLYKTGQTIITKYQNKTTNLTKQKIEEILTEINKIGESYINLIDNMQITQNPEITDLQTLLQTADKLNLSLAENSDLDISDEKTWRDTIKDSLETIQLEGTTAEHKSYHYIKAKNMLTWTSNMLEIYIDEYIQANPINITYSTTALTNKDVTATLNIGPDSHVTNNNNKNTYTFQENGEYIFEYERRGRNFQAKATVNNIDKAPPKITGAEDGQVYNQSVKLKITDQNLEKIELYLNGTLQENYTQTQNITQEGFYEVKATDKAGNVTTVNFDIIYREEDEYDVTTDKICNITVNTTAEKIADKLPIKQEYTILRNEKELQKGEKVATGDILKLTSGREYTLIVKGDLNSDGTVNIVDLVRTQNAILKRRELTNIEELAADANYDKEQITIKDLVRIQMTILNPPKM